MILDFLTVSLKIVGVLYWKVVTLLLLLIHSYFLVSRFWLKYLLLTLDLMHFLQLAMLGVNLRRHSMKSQEADKVLGFLLVCMLEVVHLAQSVAWCPHWQVCCQG